MNISETKKIFKIKNFRQPQEKIITNILNKKTTLALLPTGYGKSICYQIPGMINNGYTLVISPLIALMDDQVAHLKKINIKSIALHSNQKIKYKKFLSSFINKKYKFIYISPEKLILSNFNKIIKNNPPSLIAIDEAHCFSIWGDGFRAIYRELPSFISSINQQPTIGLFTATAAKKIIKDLKNNFHVLNKDIFAGDFFRKNLFIIHKKFYLRSQRFLYICYLVFQKYKNKNGIIYCLTRKEVEMLHQSLKKLDFTKQLKIDFFHAGLKKEIKQKIINDFINNKIKILITTNAFGMGIDKGDIEFVIHAQVPERLESYVQEIGRAGRNGKLSFCELLTHDYDFEIQQNLTKKSKLNIDMKKFIFNDCCHHQKILNFFGQTTAYQFRCNACNLCSPHQEIIINQLNKNCPKIDTFINQQKIIFNYLEFPDFFNQYISVGTGFHQMC